MIDFVTFLHTIGAVGMGLYLLLPFLVGRVTQLTGEGQAGLADGLVFANRIAQYCLVLQLLTGGYMMTNADYTVLWMVLITVLFLAIAALGASRRSRSSGLRRRFSRDRAHRPTSDAFASSALSFWFCTLRLSF